MAKVILICGRICSGKSTYADKLCRENRAIVLSVDEIMLTLFDRELGKKHNEYTERIKSYLFEKSLAVIINGVNVILDWGFWKKEDREYAKDFYKSKGIEVELHYIDVTDEQWKARIDKRNRAVRSAVTDAYYVDDTLVKKFLSLFEPPDEKEIDISIKTTGEI